MKISPSPRGVRLLDEVEDCLRKYVVLPSDADYIAVSLWIVATHCLPAFDVAPRLVIRSARKRSGKTRLLEIIRQLSHEARLMSNVSDAVMYRSTGGDHPKTFLIDEADTLFGSAVGTQRENLRGIIDAGFERGSYIPRMAGPHTREVIDFEAFAMVALGGIGQMPETIEDRAIVVVMKPRLEDERIQPFRRTDRQPLEDLNQRLTEWAQSRIETLQTRKTDLPVEDRAADLWHPLIAIADEVGGMWPDRSRSACVELTDRHRENDSDRSIPVRLLGDIKLIFDERKRPFLPSAELVQQLEAIGSVWDSSNLGPHRLARQLREFEVRPKQSPDRKARGYYRIDLEDAFRRHL